VIQAQILGCGSPGAYSAQLCLISRGAQIVSIIHSNPFVLV